MTLFNLNHKVNLLILTGIVGGAIASWSCTRAEAYDTSSDGDDSSRSRVLTPVVSPAVPYEVEFCGKKYDLDRMDMFERFDRELTAMTFTHGTTLSVIKRANRYFPMMAPILKEEKVPLDLLYLACIESSLNNRALSGAKAAGLWQFMPATAKEYGLEVSEQVDERYNTELATRAACRFLKKAYAKLGNWESVAAAYNGGMNRITRELEAQGSDTAFDLYLTDETSRYPFRMMAMKEIMQHPADYGFRLTSNDLYRPIEVEYVEVTDSVADWPAWAADHGMTFHTLRDLNPWIRAKKLDNPKNKVYKVAVASGDALSRRKAPNPVYNPNWVIDQQL